MALVRARDAAKMSKEERATKLKELWFARIKGSVTSQRAAAKTKEVKRAIARLMTFNALRVNTEVKKK